MCQAKSNVPGDPTPSDLLGTEFCLGGLIRAVLKFYRVFEWEYTGCPTKKGTTRHLSHKKGHHLKIACLRGNRFFKFVKKNLRNPVLK